MFSQAADKMFGENGAMELTSEGVGDSRVALFNSLVRNLADNQLGDLFNQCLIDASSQESPQYLADIFVMCMQTRDCRGGKGERDLFYKLLLLLHRDYPETVHLLLPAIGEYGYYKDFFQILESVEGEQHGPVEALLVLKRKIIDFVANQLIADAEAVDNGRSPSLCAKYAPREGGRYKQAYDMLRAALFPEGPAAVAGGRKESRARYRQLISKIAKSLAVTETLMCGKRFGEINFSSVPSLCANKYRKAFLNEKVKDTPPFGAEEETGNRFPDDADRVACRQNLRRSIAMGAINGLQLFPHTLVGQIMKSHGRLGAVEKELYDAQWAGMRQGVLDRLEEAKAKSAAIAAANGELESPAGQNTMDARKFVPMVDVSGSMSGEPMEVAIALGILVSEINHIAFRDRFITFETRPSWVNLSGISSITDKVAFTQRAGWGGSTNIMAAFDRIIEVVRKHKLPASEIPDLIVFSDMQFDQADREGLTIFETLQARFAALGEELSGTPYDAPRVVFWNLRSCVGYPAAADTPNVQMLSGFSPSLLKVVLEGGDAPAAAEDESTEEGGLLLDEDGRIIGEKKPSTRPQVTPYDTMRRVLDDDRYDAIRTILSGSTEGLLANYSFTAPEKVEAVAGNAAAAVARVKGTGAGAKSAGRGGGGRGRGAKRGGGPRRKY